MNLSAQPPPPSHAKPPARHGARSRLWPLLVVGIFTAAARGQDKPPEEKPIRLQDVTDAAGFPDWFRVSGDLRLRYEGHSDQFRIAARLDPSDSLVVQRTSLRFDAMLDAVQLTLELLDARHYGGGRGSALDTTVVNGLDILQASVGIDLGEFGPGEHRLTLGRRTFDVGSRRFVSRNNFRNTINSFNGAWWEWKDETSHFHGFWTLPTDREPSDLESVIDNDIEFDAQTFDAQFFGAFYQFAPAKGHTIEAYAFGLLDEAPGTRNRDLGTIGGRYVMAKSAKPRGIIYTDDPGEFDLEFEAAYQFGDSRASASGAEQDHSAWFAHAAVGYTFDAGWPIRVQLALDYATGDRDPTDGDNNRFDTLFGARRWEYGPTGIWGAVARANLLSPELRVQMRPRKDLSAFVATRAVFLADSQDAWTPAALRDTSGDSGRFVGQQIEGGARWQIIEKSLQLEVGGAILFAGEFQDDAPGGRGTDSYYGYVELTWTF